MNKKILIGSTILLFITAVALLLHNFKDTRIAQNSLIPNQHKNLFPEQRFLLNGPININKATLEELEAIPHIGPSLALKIYDYIKQKDGISDINELLELRGIGPSNIKRITEYVYIANQDSW